MAAAGVGGTGRSRGAWLLWIIIVILACCLVSSIGLGVWGVLGGAEEWLAEKPSAASVPAMTATPTVAPMVTMTPTSEPEKAPPYVVATVPVTVTKVVEVTRVVEVVATPVVTETVEAAAAAALLTATPEATADTYIYTAGGKLYAIKVDYLKDGWTRIVQCANEEKAPWTAKFRVELGTLEGSWTHSLELGLTGVGEAEIWLARDLESSQIIDPDPYDMANLKGSALGLGWFVSGGGTEGCTVTVNGKTLPLDGSNVYQMNFPRDMKGIYHVKIKLTGGHARLWQGERLTARDNWPLPPDDLEASAVVPSTEATATPSTVAKAEAPVAMPSASDSDPGAGEVADGVESLADGWKRLREAGGYCSWSSQYQTEGVEVVWQQCVKGVVSGSGTLTLRPDEIGYGQSDTRGTGLSWWFGGSGRVKVGGGEWVDLTPTLKVDFPKDGGEVVLEFEDAEADFWLGEN